MAQVLLTGATGVLGRHVLPELVRAGHDVTALSRGKPRDAAGPARWVQGDLATGQGLQPAAAGAQVIVHCATHPFKTAKVDVEGLRRLRQANPKARIVYPSIVGVDKVAFPYYRQKLACEGELATGEHTIVRFTQFHEFPHQLAALPALLVPAGFRTQPIAAREAAQVLAKAVDGPAGRRPDVGGPGVHELRTLVRRVAKANGRWTPVLSPPMPGSAGFRRGENLCLDQRVGRQSWDDHFQEWLTAGKPALG